MLLQMFYNYKYGKTGLFIYEWLKMLWHKQNVSTDNP